MPINFDFLMTPPCRHGDIPPQNEGGIRGRDCLLQNEVTQITSPQNPNSLPQIEGGAARGGGGRNMPHNRKINPGLTPRAIELRKNMTKQEKHLWYDFLRTYPVRIMRQRVIGNYISDFYCAKAKLVIEIDGSQHFTTAGLRRDAEREKFMQNLGIKTIRYSNNDIDNTFDSVCLDIDRTIKELMR